MTVNIVCELQCTVDVRYRKDSEPHVMRNDIKFFLCLYSYATMYFGRWMSVARCYNPEDHSKNSRCHKNINLIYINSIHPSVESSLKISLKGNSHALCSVFTMLQNKMNHHFCSLSLEYEVIFFYSVYILCVYSTKCFSCLNLKNTLGINST